MHFNFQSLHNCFSFSNDTDILYQVGNNTLLQILCISFRNQLSTQTRQAFKMPDTVIDPPWVKLGAIHITNSQCQRRHCIQPSCDTTLSNSIKRRSGVSKSMIPVLAVQTICSIKMMKIVSHIIAQKTIKTKESAKSFLFSLRVGFSFNLNFHQYHSIPPSIYNIITVLI